MFISDFKSIRLALIQLDKMAFYCFPFYPTTTILMFVDSPLAKKGLRLPEINKIKIVVVNYIVHQTKMTTVDSLPTDLVVQLRCHFVVI